MRTSRKREAEKNPSRVLQVFCISGFEGIVTFRCHFSRIPAIRCGELRPAMQADLTFSPKRSSASAEADACLRMMHGDGEESSFRSSDYGIADGTMHHLTQVVY